MGTMTGGDRVLISRVTIGIQAVHPLAEAVRAYGADVAALFHDAGLDPAVLDDPDGRIPLHLLDGLWDGAARVTGDECLGLHAAERVSEGSFGLVSYLGLASPTVGDGLRRVTTYFRLLSEGSAYEIERSGDRAQVTATQSVRSPAPVRQRVEFTVTVVYGYLQRHVARPWRAREVFFEHDAPGPACLAEHARIYAECAPRFAAGASGFAFDAALLDEPLRSADRSLMLLLERLAGQMLAERTEVKTIAAELKLTLLETGPGPDASLTTSAQRMGLSPRTLQRRLREEGTSHHEVLDEVRAIVARRLLDGNAGLAEVAFALGFSEPAAFHRAFKRWTGQTPSAFRKRALAT
jgi:AraC-like DNA-binding protein